jgi:hypothetical protein
MQTVLIISLLLLVIGGALFKLFYRDGMQIVGTVPIVAGAAGVALSGIVTMLKVLS